MMYWRNKISTIIIFIILILLGGNVMTENTKTNASKDKRNIQEGYIAVTGGRVWYKIIGKNTPGIPLLVIHGGPGASHHYLEPIADLADERPVIFYDQLGCGNSDNPNDSTLWAIERFVDELQQVIHTLDLDKVHLLGQSWGTSLAVEYVLTKQSHGVESLILSGPLLSASRWIEDQKAYIEELPEDVKKAILRGEESGVYDSGEYQEAMMLFYQKHVCRLEEWPEYLNTAFAKLNLSQYKYMWGPSEFTVTGTLKNYERVDQLKKITIPTLFTCGEYDEATPTTTRYYQQNLPGSQLHIFKDASHEHHIEKREEYLSVVRKFLNIVENE
jgi:proline iminopeptidase